ncbi:MAG: tetratricopeptide repeat protein [Leptospiraceae bacterium]|nr:tetratricopeptide repeat protein [Leptospiraceae bacterium]MCK6380439.1 tetratricopeptide repeat protein [Leptospiraceae bacterium]
MKNQAYKFIIIGFFLFPVMVFSKEQKKNCTYTSISGEVFSVYPEYFLSLAISEQTAIFHHNTRKTPSAKTSSYSKSLEYYEKYFQCLNQNGKTPNPTSFYLKSLNYFELRDFPSALKEIETVIEISPKFRDAYFLKSRIFIRQERLKEASEFLERNISMFPEDSDMLFLLGSLFSELGNQPKAILYHSSLLDSIEKREGEARYKTVVLKSLGENYNKSDQIRKALFYYRNLLRYEPFDTDVRYKVAQILNSLGEFGGSKRELQTILKSNPGNLHVELLLGEMYFIESRVNAYSYFDKLDSENKLPAKSLMENLHFVLTGKYFLAEKFFLDYLSKNPMRLSARLALVEIYKRTKKFSELSLELKKTAELAFSIKQYVLASELIEELVQLWKKNPDLKGDFARAYDFLASCYEESLSPNRAIVSSRKAIELAGNSIESENFKLHLAYILRLPNVRKYQESIEIIREVIQLNPDSAYANFLLGLNYLGLEKYKESIHALTNAFALESKNSLYVFYRGTAYDKKGDLPNALTDLQKAIELDPNNSNAHNYLGYLYLEKNMEVDKAFRLILRAVELEPDNGAFQDSLGWVYFKLNRLDDAIHHLNLALQLMADRNDTDPVVFDHLGDVYFKKNEILLAMNFWEKAIPLILDKKEKKRVQVKIDKAKTIKVIQ